MKLGSITALRSFRSCRLAGIFALLALGIILVSLVAARARAAVAPAAEVAQADHAAADSQAVPSRASNAGAEQQQETSLKETEQRDDRTAFLHSVVVRSVGRVFHLGPEAAARLFEFFNFALLAIVVLYFFIKFFPRYLRAHRDQIRNQLLDARTATEQANAQLKAVEEKLRGLDREIRSIREQADRDSRAEEARIHALIEGERRRILSSADREIAAAAAEARREIKRFAGGIAIERAREMVSLSDTEDRALTSEIASRLARQAAVGDFEPKAESKQQNGERN